MAIENIQKITLDFCRNNVQTVYVKQYDKKSRFIIVKCTDNGKFITLDKNSMACTIKILTPDNRAILSSCEILSDGTVKVELTESALFSSGVANAELFIVNTNESQRLGTMKFRLIIDSSVYSDDRVIDSDEFSALTELINKASKDYTYITKEAKKSADAAKVSETNAKSSETNAALSASKAKTSETNAKASEDNAKISENNANTYMENASNSASAASGSATLAESYTHGGTGSRAGEDTDNAKYYYEKAKNTEIGKVSETVEGLSNDVGVLSARLDNIASLPEGSTTGDAELQDIRVKADGTIATSAGNAVREQISELKGDLDNYIALNDNGISDDIMSNATITSGYYRSGVFTPNDYIKSTLVNISILDIDLVMIDAFYNTRNIGYSFFDDSFNGADPIVVQSGNKLYAEIDRTAKYLYIEYATEDVKPIVKLKKSIKENIDISQYCEIKKGFYGYIVGQSIFYPSEDFTTFVFDNDYNLRVFEFTSTILNNNLRGVVYLDENYLVIDSEVSFETETNLDKYNVLSSPNAKYIAFTSYTANSGKLIVKEKDSLIVELINESTVLTKKYTYTDGSTLDVDQFRTITFNCNQGETYLYRGCLQVDTFNTCAIFKDENENIIGHLDVVENGYRERVIVIPAGAKKVTLNYISTIGTATTKFAKIIDGVYYTDSNYSKTKNLKVCINGDSISTKEAGRWPLTLEQTIPLSKCINVAVGGTTLSQISSQERISQIPTNTNLFITDCGEANDFGGVSPTTLGGIDTINDTATYYGLLNQYFSKLNERIPNAKIIVASNQFGFVPNIGIKNSLGYSRYDYINAVKDVCKYNSIEYCPVFEECGINQFNYEEYNMHEVDIDGTGWDVWVHPNIKGSNKMLNVIMRSINKFVDEKY